MRFLVSSRTPLIRLQVCYAIGGIEFRIVQILVNQTAFPCTPAMYNFISVPASKQT